MLNNQDQLEEQTLEINPEEITGYLMTRSLADNKLFCVYAVDKDGNLLYAAGVDLDFETASLDVEQLNQDLSDIKTI